MKTLLSQWVLVLALASSLYGQQENADEPDGLIRLRAAYTEARSAKIKPLTEKYMEALDNLKKELTKSGKLDEALIVQAQENGTNKLEESKQPRKLVTINRIYNRKKDELSREVTLQYIAALKSLQEKLSKANKLNEAVKVKAEHDKYAGQIHGDSGPQTNTKSELPETEEEFADFIIGTSWRFSSAKPGNGYTFQKNGKFVSKGLTISYKVTGLRTVTIDWGGGTRVRCKISKDYKKMKELDGSRGLYLRDNE